MRYPAPDSSAEDDARFLRQLVLWAFLIRAMAALLLDWTGYSKMLAPDETTYASYGRRLALYWTGDNLIKPARFETDDPQAYFYMNAASYYLFGATQLPLKLANALVGAITCRYVFLLAQQLFGVAVARRTARLVQLFPSLVLWSAVNIRDVWVIFLVVFISWKSLQLSQGYSRLALGQFALALFLLSRFRDYLFLVVSVPPVVALLIGNRGNLIRNFLVSSAAAIAVLLLLQSGAMGQRTQAQLSLEAMSEIRRDMATGSSAFEREADISTPGRALAFLPIGLAYFLFSPFPWQITSLLKLFSVPEMLIIYYLTPSIIRGIRHAVRHRFRESFQLLLLTTLLTLSYALGSGNVGTLYRHRAQAIAFYLMFGAAGLEVARQRRVPGSRIASLVAVPR
jgi:hypothetical protein